MNRFVLTNWRIVLLGITSIVLSIASGWTTLDGMSNFTSAPVLSFLITFGIQSVMLISAWMLGEAVVNRFQRNDDRSLATPRRLWLAVVAVVALPLAGLLLLSWFEVATVYSVVTRWWGLILTGLLLLFAATLFLGSRNSANSPRATFNTTMLLVMFTACMATSVFFSFDSLFSAVFPDAERSRASEIRAKSETDKILSDLMTVAQQERIGEKARLLEGPVWRAYADGLDRLRIQTADGIAALNRERAALVKQQGRAMEIRGEERAEKQAIRDRARRREAGLKDRLEKLRMERGEASSSRDKLDEQIRQSTRQLRDAEVRALKEEQGLGESKLAGRGPIYERLIGDVARAKIEVQRQEAERDAAARRVAEIETKIEGTESELVVQSVSASGAESALTAQDTSTEASGLKQNDNLKAEIKAKLTELDASRATFESAMTREALEQLGLSCRLAADAIKRAGGSGNVSCSTAEVNLAAAPVFSLSSGIAVLSSQCSSSDAKAYQTAVNALVTRARDCLQLASLSPNAAEKYRRGLDNIERNRDDRAHRFIVTMNAFSDGNKLAYLALAIAVGIDGLVFISGLLAAATRASPFRSLPGAAGHSVAGADRIMRSALLPDPSNAARLALSVILPMPSEPQQGASEFSHQINLADVRVRRSRDVIQLMNAATGIGAARRLASRPDVYELRREVIDFLALHVADGAPVHPLDATSSDWHEQTRELLWNEPRPALETFVNYVRPANADGDFVYRIDLDDVEDHDKTRVIKIINAAALNSGVRPSKEGGAHIYDIHRAIMVIALEVVRDTETVAPKAAAASLPLPDLPLPERKVPVDALHNDEAINEPRKSSAPMQPPAQTNPAAEMPPPIAAVKTVKLVTDAAIYTTWGAEPDVTPLTAPAPHNGFLAATAVAAQDAKLAAPVVSSLKLADMEDADHQRPKVQSAAAKQPAAGSTSRPVLPRALEDPEESVLVKIVGDTMKFDLSRSGSD